jgi:protein-tyrosine phosphatase
LNNNKDSKNYKLFLKEHKNKNVTVSKYNIKKDNEKNRIENENIKFPIIDGISKIEKKLYENKDIQFKRQNNCSFDKIDCNKAFGNNLLVNSYNRFNSYTKKPKITEICPLCNKEIESIRITSHIKLHPSKIFDWLYLGNYRNSKDINTLKDLKINYILNCAIECKFKNDLPTDINCLHIKINDVPYIDITSYFEETNEFIHKAKLSGGKILVHCFLCSSRSSTFVIAYMIKYMGYTIINALNFLKDKRPIVMPNTGFLMQLQKYENKIKNEKNLF